MPNPRAMPLTSWVLPAPNSPLRPMIQPGLASRPHCSPRAMVSSGLCEMNVAMNGQRLHALLVAKLQAGLGGDLADAGEWHVDKLLLPAIQQRHRVAPRDGEKQFEVFPGGQGGEQGRFGGGVAAGMAFGRRADGDGVLAQLGADAASLEQMTQITGQPIAEVDHR